MASGTIRSGIDLALFVPCNEARVWDLNRHGLPAVRGVGVGCVFSLSCVIFLLSYVLHIDILYILLFNILFITVLIVLICIVSIVFIV